MDCDEVVFQGRPFNRCLLKLYQGDKQIKLFQKELQVAQLLSKDHPNIVKFISARDFSLVTHQNSLLTFNLTTCGILYEFSPCNDLFSYVANKASVMNRGMCNIIFAQIVKGVAFMHSQNVCHYDIKLENVVLDGDYIPKIIDFGLCDLTSTPIVNGKGTTGYIAPEIY